jgi:hypothetical protein
VFGSNGAFWLVIFKAISFDNSYDISIFRQQYVPPLLRRCVNESIFWGVICSKTNYRLLQINEYDHI